VDQFEPEIQMTLQEKDAKSIPDATITQDSFKVVIETKLSDWFYKDQLQRHLDAFNNEQTKVLMTLAPEELPPDKIDIIQNTVEQYNKEHSTKVWYIHRTFRKLIDSLTAIIDDRDYEMQDVLDDYKEFCSEEGLLPSRAVMRMQLSGTTFDFNLKTGVYYDIAEHGFRAHQYLGLYKNKSVRAIGKICARIRAVKENGIIRYEEDGLGKVTEERKKIIQEAMKDSEQYGYNIQNREHRYFFVEKFYETDYQKTSPGGCMGSRIFDLEHILALGPKEPIPDTEEIAERLKHLTWK
jgi:hypothetical protein